MTDPAQLYGHLVAAFNHRQWQQVLDVAAKLLPLAPRHAGDLARPRPRLHGAAREDAEIR